MSVLYAKHLSCMSETTFRLESLPHFCIRKRIEFSKNKLFIYDFIGMLKEILNVSTGLCNKIQTSFYSNLNSWL